MRTKLSVCGRFVVLDGMHLDRDVFEFLERWAAERELHMQDAVQLALCALRDSALERSSAPAMPASSSRVLARPSLLDRID